MKHQIKIILLLVVMVLAACNSTAPADLSPMETQIALLEERVAEGEALDNSHIQSIQSNQAYAESIAGTVNVLIEGVGEHSELIDDLMNMYGQINGAPFDVEYVIYGSDGRLMNDGAIQPVRSHVVNGEWILEFHIANFDRVNVTEYFHIVPTNPTPTGWVAGGAGTCYADSANRDSQGSGAALWKRYDFSENRWGLICAWDAEHGFAYNLWGKGINNSLRINTFANGTGTEWHITVPWD